MEVPNKLLGVGRGGGGGGGVSEDQKKNEKVKAREIV